MKIGNVYFWIDRDSSQIGIRSKNQQTNSTPIEAYLNRRPRLLDFQFYQDGGDEAHASLRLTFALLWISINAMICRISASSEEQAKIEQLEGKAWGWTILDNSLSFSFGSFRRSFMIPFVSSVHKGSEILSLDRSRVVYKEPEGVEFFNEYDKRKGVKAQHSAAFHYNYETDKGVVQGAMAIVSVNRTHRRWKWTPFKFSSDFIDVRFSEGIGALVGSWKGGCTGCSYAMKKKETARECIRRMERDRRFER